MKESETRKWQEKKIKEAQKEYEKLEPKEEPKKEEMNKGQLAGMCYMASGVIIVLCNSFSRYVFDDELDIGFMVFAFMLTGLGMFIAFSKKDKVPRTQERSIKEVK